MICTRCRRALTLHGKRNCRDCHDYNVRRSRFLSLTSEADDRQALYAMRTLTGHLKVGRSCNVFRRSKQLSADVIRVWPGLGRLEPSIHRLLGEFQVSREVFDCPLAAVEHVVEHITQLDAYIKDTHASQQ